MAQMVLETDQLQLKVKRTAGDVIALCTQTCYDCCESILIMCAICGIRLSENQNVSAVESKYLDVYCGRS